METHHPRRTTRRAAVKSGALLAAALAFAPPGAQATGDFYEEPLQTLADYLRLDQLPAKSIGQVLAETGKAETPAEIGRAHV